MSFMYCGGHGLPFPCKQCETNLRLRLERDAEQQRRAECFPDLLEALRFILAFYEPGQTHLDTNAWKLAEASGRAAVAKATGETS